MSATRSPDATVEALCGDLSAIRAPRGTELNARSWSTEAPLRMLLNNLDPEVAERPEELVVYGGSGKAARNPEALRALVRSLLELGEDETLLVQSGKPVGVFRTSPAAPRVLIANSLLVPRWATWDEFRRLEALGLTMFGQMTAGSWIYIGSQGILQGTYQTFVAAAEKHFGSADLAGRTILTAGLGGMGGAQPLAATLAGAAILCVEVDPERIRRRLETRYLDEAADSLDDALERVRAAAREGRALSVGVLGNAAEVVPELARRGEAFDLVTDQTAAHDPLTGYVPAGLDVDEAAALRERDPDEYLRRARESIARHVEGMLDYARGGSHVFDYGNNLRGEALEAGVEDAFALPGLRPGLHPAALLPRRRAVPLGGALRRSGRHRRDRPGAARALPGRRGAAALADRRSRARRLPGAAGADLLARLRRPRARRARDQRARPQRRGQGAGRDRPRPSRLGLGRLALPRDRGDAGRLRRDRRLADPERALERGRRRDLGQRPSRRRRRDRQLDPRRHGRPRRRQRRAGRAARAGADDRSRHGRDAPRGRRLRRRARRRRGARAPAASCRRSDVAAERLLVRDLAQVVSPADGEAPLRGAELGQVDVLEDAFVLCEDGAIAAVGRMRDLAAGRRGRGARRLGPLRDPGLVDCHTHPAFLGDRVGGVRPPRARRELRGAARRRRRDPLRRSRATRAGSDAELQAAVSRHAGWMLRAGTTTFEGKSGYGLDRDTELASLAAVAAAGGVPTWLGAHAVPPEFEDADAYLDFALAEVLPAAAQVAEAADVFVEEAPSTSSRPAAT